MEKFIFCAVSSAQVAECLKCPSVRVLEFLSALSARVLSKWPSGQVPSGSNAQRIFKLVLTLTLNEKHFPEMRFKQIIGRF